MKISEAILELSKILVEIGDLDLAVYYCQNGECGDSDVSEFVVSECSSGFNTSTDDRRVVNVEYR